jgi:hypothetical protein
MLVLRLLSCWKNCLCLIETVVERIGIGVYAAFLTLIVFAVLSVSGGTTADRKSTATRNSSRAAATIRAVGPATADRCNPELRPEL